ncbi:peroxiredoxin [Streptomyces sp. NPDC005805]|uniref:peroxiredoxin n=1 Tax=Streptomyces sp. NPDC005805 TaxID=3157068 RepID=UPI0033DFD928
MARTPDVGSPAPDFTVPGTVRTASGPERGDYTLSAHRGNPLVLVFYPGDNTAVCTKQLCSYTSDLDRFWDLGATVWGISPQGLDSHEGFAEQYDLRFPLLADTDREVARAYGIAVPGLGLRRSVFVLDGEGAVRWKHIALAGLTFQSTDTLTEQIRAATGS